MHYFFLFDTNGLSELKILKKKHFKKSVQLKLIYTVMCFKVKKYYIVIYFSGV